MKQLIGTSLFLLLTGLVFTLDAQVPFTDVESKVESTDHIQQLKDGILLVRLNSNRKKMEQMYTFMEQSTDPKDSTKWAEEVEQLMVKTAEKQYIIADAIDAEYRFSAVAFFMDYDTREILEGTKNPWEADLKTETEIDPSLPVYILTHGATPESRIEGYVILDSSLNNIPRPFPNNVATSGLSALFGNDYTHIRKLNKKLFKYYHKVTK